MTPIVFDARPIPGAVLAALLIALWCGPGAAAEPAARDLAPVRVGQLLEFDLAAEAPREQVVSARIDLDAAKSATLRLVELLDDREWVVPCQIDAGAEPRLVWIVRSESAARRHRLYRLEQGTTPPCPELTIDRTDGALVVRAGQHRILQYNVAHVPAPQGVDPKYGRSGHIHPAWTPRGAVVTDEFPPDHLHQSGVFLAYTKTSFEGRSPNFWDLLGGTGRVRHKEVRNVTAGPIFASFEVEHEHVDLTVPAGKVALVETWLVRVWNLGGPDSGYWTWEINSASKCGSTSPLKLPTYHYGGMALRGARSWDGENAKFVTSEGKTRQDGNHSRPRWCDLSGPVGGQSAGIALLTHPDNFRFPEPLRIHPTMPYMVYTPSQLGEWEINPGDVHRSSYRFILHDQALAPATIMQLWETFAHPPEALVLPRR